MSGNINVDNPGGNLRTDFKYRYMNAWITPTGDIYETGYMQHEDFAGRYIYEEDEVIEKAFDDSGIIEFGAYLFKIGWIKVMQWETGIPKVITGDVAIRCHDLTKRQKDSLFDLCVKYNSDIYKEYFDEKS